MSRYVPRVKLWEERALKGAVAFRITRGPSSGSVTIMDDASAVPFPGESFQVAAIRYLDYRAPRKGESGNGHFASCGIVMGTEALESPAWDKIEAEAVRLNRLSVPCFGPTDHTYFEGGTLCDGVLYAWFGS